MYVLVAVSVNSDAGCLGTDYGSDGKDYVWSYDGAHAGCSGGKVYKWASAESSIDVALIASVYYVKVGASDCSPYGSGYNR